MPIKCPPSKTYSLRGRSQVAKPYTERPSRISWTNDADMFADGLNSNQHAVLMLTEDNGKFFKEIGRNQRRVISHMRAEFAKLGVTPRDSYSSLLHAVERIKRDYEEARRRLRNYVTNPNLTAADMQRSDGMESLKGAYPEFPVIAEALGDWPFCKDEGTKALDVLNIPCVIPADLTDSDDDSSGSFYSSDDAQPAPVPNASSSVSSNNSIVSSTVDSNIIQIPRSELHTRLFASTAVSHGTCSADTTDDEMFESMSYSGESADGTSTQTERPEASSTIHGEELHSTSIIGPLADSSDTLSIRPVSNVSSNVGLPSQQLFTKSVPSIPTTVPTSTATTSISLHSPSRFAETEPVVVIRRFSRRNKNHANASDSTDMNLHKSAKKPIFKPATSKNMVSKAAAKVLNESKDALRVKVPRIDTTQNDTTFVQTGDKNVHLPLAENQMEAARLAALTAKYTYEVKQFELKIKNTERKIAKSERKIKKHEERKIKHELDTFRFKSRQLKYKIKIHQLQDQLASFSQNP
ncbi:hypothetical protein BDF20DRAFT_911485 [Mycotypha africana]|uniref:uncharacterized protein n=1 Tax=Mycotypha africana TaxID=64632 RepID=UPI00230003D8|nr:uncharacterized protein BDF20DRAFT_911485 [Mycotypha africana]KAI8984384.1 hypothetical protein BDF20DRAFT_911485 [Mycotypha africana]